MAVTPWEDNIRKGKMLTIFPTNKVAGPWLTTFNDAIREFNRLSTLLSLGVTFCGPPHPRATKPDPVGEGGAEVQFELGSGRLTFEAAKQKFVATDKSGKPIDFSPTELHGDTEFVARALPGGASRIRRAFIFVPATPMIDAAQKVGPGPDDFRTRKRPVGSGIRLYIAVHEFIHACGLSNDEHNFQGPGADVFTIFPDRVPGAFDKPEDDKLLLHLAAPQPNVFAPPIFINTKVADLIRNNWK